MNLFEFYIPEWVFVILNLLILMFVLKKFLWTSVTKVLDERQAKIIQSLAEIEAIESERKALDERQAAFEADSERQIRELMKDARTRAGREYDRIVDEAKFKEKQILSAAQIQARQDREGALNAARGELIATAIDMAGFLLESNMDKAHNERLVTSFLERKDVRT